MKFFKFISIAVILLLAAYSMNACGGGASADLKAKLTFASGTVELLASGTADWKAAAANSDVAMSDTVRTGAKSSAKIDFSDGVKIFIEENTSVKLKEIKKPSEKSTLDIVVEIIKGALFFDVTKRENSKFEMETSTAVAGVKGTKGVVSFKDDKTNVMVIEGRVEVSLKKAPVDKVMLEPDDAIEFGDVPALSEKIKIDYSKAKFSDIPLMKNMTPDDLIKKIDVIRSNQ
jgi:hypothetical protein